MTNSQVPPTTIQRLPIYLRCLMQAQAMRMPVINSLGIAEMAGTNAAQVRKDLSYLGELGTRGIGYDVDSLIAHMMKWLGLTEARRAAIVGYGRLGSALQGYAGFQDRGFNITAVFDADPEKVGLPAGDLAVRPIEDLPVAIAEEGVDIVILAVPAPQAQAVADIVVGAGVKAILNFAPIRLDIPAGVAVRQADLSVDLQVLSFHLNRVRADAS